MNVLVRAIPVSISLASLFIATAHPHGLLHTISQGDATVVTITHDDGSPFSDQHYQVYFDTDTVAFQTGRTDALGRVTFVPDRDGRWRVRAFSEDGHGTDVVTTVSASTPPANPGRGRWLRIVDGVSILFGIFGILALFASRRTTA